MQKFFPQKLSVICASGAALFLFVSQAFALPGWHRRSLKAHPPENETTVLEESGTKQVQADEAAGAPPERWTAGSMEILDETAIGEDRVYSLEVCIEMALERNSRLRAAGYEIEAAKARLAEASATLWPVLEYQYRMAPVPKDVDDAFNKFFEGQVTLFNGLHVGVGIPLMTFGQISTAKRMAEGGVDAAELGSAKLREETVFQVEKLYYGILLAAETKKLLKDAVEKLNKKIDEEEGREVPEMDPYDLLQMKVFRTDLERRLEETIHNMDLAYEGLRIQMGLPSGARLGLDTNNLLPVIARLGPMAGYVDTAMDVKPDVKLLDIGVETKRRQYHLEKYKLMPQVGMGFFVDLGRSAGFIRGLQLTDDFNDPFNYTRAGLGLQFKGTIDFHGTYGRIRKARAEYLKAAHERQIARRALALDIRNSYLEARRAQDNVRRAKKAESMARQMMFLSKLNLDTGIGDEEKYADALKLVLLTRGQYFKSVFDYNLALSDLARHVGIAKYNELTKTPDVEYYDAFEDGEGDIMDFDD